MTQPSDAPLKKRRVRFDLKKTMFVLPNLFTLSSIFCGFYAIVLMSGGEPSAGIIKQAATLIAFALFFDLMDGRVARLTKTQSDFGMELDSLADVVSFGLAPAILSYKYGLQHLGSLGVFLAFVFAACGAIRLARFNVLAHRNPASSSAFFLGLPIPLAAGVLISVMLANGGNLVTPAGATSWAVLMLVVSYLMVSNVRYRTFKKMKSKRRAVLLFASIGSLFVLLSRVFQPGLALAMMFGVYVSMGLIEEVVFFRSRRRAEALLLGAAPIVDADPEPELEEKAAFEAEEEEEDQETLA